MTLRRRTTQTSRLQRLLPSALRIIAAVGITVLALQIELPFHPYQDFNLHYFGALIDRHGTAYTNTPAIVQAEAARHQVVTVDGIYGTPTLVAIVFKPLSYLSLNTAHAIWDFIAVAAIVIGVRSATNSPRWPLWVAFLAFSPAALQALHLGNPVVLTFCLIAIAFGALTNGKQRTAGVAVGVALALKLYPALLLFSFVKNRERRALLAAVITAFILGLVTIPILGPAHFWAGIERMRRVGGLVPMTYDNSGLPALVVHLTHNSMVARASGLAFLAGGLLVLFKIKRRSSEFTFAYCTLLMLCSATITWRLYWAFAILAMMLLHRTSATRAQLMAGWFFGIMALGYWSFIFSPNSPVPPVSRLIGGLGLMALLLATNQGASDRVEPEVVAPSQSMLAKT